jgi:hypothetical protein
MKPVASAHPRYRPLRRKVVALVRHINKGTDKIVGILAVVFLVNALADRLVRRFLEGWIGAILPFTNILMALSLVFYSVVRLLLKNASLVWAVALPEGDSKNLRNWLRTGEAPPVESCCCMCEYASARSLDALVEMNYEGFRDSSFGVDAGRLKQRDSSWMTRNPKAFMLMVDPLTRMEFIGYSCLLPLNELGAKLYLGGKLKDEDIPASLVAKAGEPANAVIVFAIVLRPEFSLAKSGASKRYGIYFYSCVFRHAVDLCEELDQSGGVPALYAQTEHRGIGRKLERLGFVRTDLKSAEGFSFWKLEQPLARLQANKPRDTPTARVAGMPTRAASEQPLSRAALDCALLLDKLPGSQRRRILKVVKVLIQPIDE